MASIKSALPLRLEIDRLPCFTTGSAAGGRQQRRAGGQIQAPGAIAAGADDVDGIYTFRQRGLQRQRAHSAGETAHLVGRDAFGAQR